MRHRVLLPLVLLLCTLALAQQVGDPAPRFSLKTMDGEKLTNDSLKGKVVLIQFWTTWCGYCRREEAMVNELTRAYAKDLVVLAVNVGEGKSKVKKYLKDRPRDPKIVLNDDTNLPALFQANAYPVYVTLDKQGNIAGIQRGAGGERALRSLLRRAGLALD